MEAFKRQIWKGYVSHSKRNHTHIQEFGLWPPQLNTQLFPQEARSSALFLKCSSSLSLWVSICSFSYFLYVEIPFVHVDIIAFNLALSCFILSMLVHARLFLSCTYIYNSHGPTYIGLGSFFFGCLLPHHCSTKPTLFQIGIFLALVCWSSVISVWSVEPMQGTVTSKPSE